jgi:hypothetical protein
LARTIIQITTTALARKQQSGADDAFDKWMVQDAKVVRERPHHRAAVHRRTIRLRPTFGLFCSRTTRIRRILADEPQSLSIARNLKLFDRLYGETAQLPKNLALR